MITRRDLRFTSFADDSTYIACVRLNGNMMTSLVFSKKALSSTRCASFLRFRGARLISTRNTTYTLNTGAQIPALGFGTFQDANAQEEAVSKALKAGVRLIDTARVYDVEKEVGKGIRRSGIPRHQLFVATKLWCNQFHSDDVESALSKSLTDLDTSYVDLFMMHYPVTFKRGTERFPRDENGTMILGETTFLDTWKAMEKLIGSGKARAIGVSNFSKAEIETLIHESDTVRQQHNHDCSP